MVSGKNITSLNSLVEAKGSAFAAGYKRQQQKATDTSQSLCTDEYICFRYNPHMI